MLDFYHHGQRVALFSLIDARSSSSGWSWAGNNIAFEESAVRPHPDQRLFTLRFELEPPHADDLLLLASSPPYSYSRLLADLRALQAEARALDHVSFTCGSAGSTVCENEVPEVTITGRAGTGGKTGRAGEEKRVVVVMARQHPG